MDWCVSEDLIHATVITATATAAARGSISITAIAAIRARRSIIAYSPIKHQLLITATRGYTQTSTYVGG